MTSTFDYKAYNALRKTPAFWGRFELGLGSHKYILSLLRQLDWVTVQSNGYSVADIERFGTWLQSDKSPVQKPLKKMTQAETSKIIVALEIMTQKKYSNAKQ